MKILMSLLALMLSAYSLYACVSVWAAWQWRRAKRSVNRDWTPEVTILKPVRGVDVEAYETFASFCRLDYPAGKVQLLFGALDPTDPALDVVRRLQCDFPEQDIRIVCGGPESLRGHNLKVCNLASMLPFAKYDLLIICDSDMHVTPDYLRRVVAPFEPARSINKKKVTSPETSRKAQVGLVTCPYRGYRPKGLASALEALGIGADFIPSAMVSRATEGVGFAFGSTIVIPRELLRELGGFESMYSQLADDYRLGNGIQKAGYNVILSDYTVDDVLGEEDLNVMWARRLRWMRTTRSCRPGGYAGSVITYGTALSLIFLLTTGFSPVGWSVFTATLALRLTSALIVACLTGDPNVRRFLPLLPVSDLVSFALFLGSYGGNRIMWRGEQFRLLSGGRIEHLPRLISETTPAGGEKLLKTGQEV